MRDGQRFWDILQVFLGGFALCVGIMILYFEMWWLFGP